MIRLLVFEYMTGGGFVGRSLPDALLHEGCLMRHALLDDLKSLKVDVWILTDERVPIRETEKCLDWQYLTICEGDNLQEILQAKHLPLPDYQVIETQGEAHKQQFVVQCELKSLGIKSIAEGRSRKIAEQKAASELLARLESD